MIRKIPKIFPEFYCGKWQGALPRDLPLEDLHYVFRCSPDAFDRQRAEREILRRRKAARDRRLKINGR